MPDTPNIIFIVLDTFRADRFLGTHENKSLTPFIKSLLNNSILFKNCLANTCWTAPSHISFFSGLYPSQNKLLSKNIVKLDKKIPIITELLQSSSYSTLCYTENPWINKNSGLTRGFDKVINAWDENPWQKAYSPFSLFFKILDKIDKLIEEKINIKPIKILWKNLQNRIIRVIKDFLITHLDPFYIFNLKDQNIKQKSELQKFILQNNGNPLYLFFNFMSTHDPYIPLRNFINSFNIKGKDLKNINEMLISPLRYRLKIAIESQKVPRKKVQSFNKLYNACVLSADNIIRNIFDILKRNNLLENTFIIITSDHGEHLGTKYDNYLWEHSTYLSLKEQLVNVPLLIYNSKLKGQIIQEQVELKDLFHTILELVNSSGTKNRFLDSERSIFQQIKQSNFPKYIFGEYIKAQNHVNYIIESYRKTINEDIIPKLKSNIYFLRSNYSKLIYYDNADHYEYYNLSDDPYEQINIYDEKNHDCLEMKKKLDNKISEINDKNLLKDLITEKEKESLKNTIKNIKLIGI